MLVCGRARLGSGAPRQQGRVCRIPVYELDGAVRREDHVFGFQVAVRAFRPQQLQRRPVEGAGNRPCHPYALGTAEKAVERLTLDIAAQQAVDPLPPPAHAEDAELAGPERLTVYRLKIAVRAGVAF